ncbi:MAG: NUDIX hydrolase [Candidatus Electryonea clarkiae]|nr:NUDIX hydrolase [Candidatus Electryonea clarkiae]MDP8288126.1 NUDIX hydrolase [Candidatus Electryonea clarkiae]
MEKYLNPFPTVDVIIRYESGVVLIKRKNPPYGWAIPGGFVNYNESTETTAVREMREETGLELKNLELFTVRSNPARDPRFHTITVIYTADGIGEIVAGDDAAEAHVFHFDKLPEKMAFDHRDILDEYCNVKV